MTILTVSSKGQIVLPVKIRKRFGLKAGSQLEMVESDQGLILKLNTSVTPVQDVVACAGLIKAKSSGQKRSLDDFDAADIAEQP